MAVPKMLNLAFCLSFLLAMPLSAEPEDSSAPSIQPIEEVVPLNKLHILYLMQSKEIDKSIDLYLQYKQLLGRHDFEILQQMALIILEMGMRSQDPEQQLISLFGSSIAGISASIDILEAGIMSPQPQTQMAAIQFLGRIQDDRCDELLTKAMSSDFFFTRMEAAHQLAIRKSRNAVGQIESLMYRIPPQMRFFFPQFFALIGTSDAISLLRQMMDESFHMTRIEAVLSAARFGRDDLLPSIRARATHASIAEQEACATALGMLKDSKSAPMLKILSQSPSPNIRLAALKARHVIGDESAKEEILELAKTHNLFAITTLGSLPGSENFLRTLVDSPDIQLRFNASLALLQRRDSRAVASIKDFLIRDSRDLGFQIQYSIGNSLLSWKVIPSAMQHNQEGTYDIVAFSLSVREQMLRDCVELPEKDFLDIAAFLFDVRQGDLIPLLVSLLENVQTPNAIHLLQKHAQIAGSPLIRTYCNLALFRLKLIPKETLLNWITLKKTNEMIRFRPMLPWDVRSSEKASAFELTPEENSRLLIECYQTLSLEHDEKGIDIILDGLKTGHIKNRSVLAGLLIQAIQ